MPLTAGPPTPSVTTNPIPTLRGIPTSGTDKVEIVGKVVGPLGGLILLAIMSSYHHSRSSQSNLNNPIKLMIKKFLVKIIPVPNMERDKLDHYIHRCIWTAGSKYVCDC